MISFLYTLVNWLPFSYAILFCGADLHDTIFLFLPRFTKGDASEARKENRSPVPLSSTIINGGASSSLFSRFTKGVASPASRFARDPW